jgi:uncharacterized membrane protein
MIWLYPIYTLGFKPIPGLIGNVVVGVFATFAIFFVRRVSVKAALLITPVVLWLSAATFFLALQINLIL